MASKHVTLWIVSILISNVLSECTIECPDGQQCRELNNELICETIENDGDITIAEYSTIYLECGDINDCLSYSIDGIYKDNVRCKQLPKRIGTGSICCIRNNFYGCSDQVQCCGKNQCNNGQCGDDSSINDQTSGTGTESKAVITDEKTDRITFLGIKNVDPTVIWIICALIATFTILICIGFYLCVYKKDDDIFNDDNENSFSSSKDDEIRAEIEMGALEQVADHEQDDDEDDDDETPPTSTHGYFE